MKVLLVENDDSFSWNVVDLLPIASSALEVRHRSRVVSLNEIDVLVIGPGPTDPRRAELISMVREAAERKLPTLGICLGHQALGVALGATLVRSEPAHGKRAKADFQGATWFSGIDGQHEVMRYHSLSLTEVKSPLRVVAKLSDGTVMAVEHESLPMAGLQFHPDSFGTPTGRAMVAAFFHSVLPR